MHQGSIKMIKDLRLKPFYFIRHGQTDWNHRRVCMGSQDIPLNATGEAQALEIVHVLKNEPIKQILTSPLIRAKKTAEIINNILKLEIVVVDEFAECAFGEYEGKPYSENTLKDWTKGELYSGSEHIKDFEARISNGLLKAFNFSAPSLIVGHGAVYFAMQKILGLPFLNIRNCAPIFHEPLIEPDQQWLIKPLLGDEEMYDK